jgi:hypothetical protein
MADSWAMPRLELQPELDGLQAQGRYPNLAVQGCHTVVEHPVALQAADASHESPTALHLQCSRSLDLWPACEAKPDDLRRPGRQAETSPDAINTPV